MGFLELRRQCGVSHEVRRGAQGASRVVPGKSGVYACDEEEPINALESWHTRAHTDTCVYVSMPFVRVCVFEQSSDNMGRLSQ